MKKINKEGKRHEQSSDQNKQINKQININAYIHT